MASHSSATAREQALNSINSITNNTLKLKASNDDIPRREWSLLRNKSIDEGSRSLIGYALEINDPALPELMRRAEAGESVVARQWSKFKKRYAGSYRRAREFDAGPSSFSFVILQEFLARKQNEERGDAQIISHLSQRF